MWPTVRMAKKMGKRLAAREILQRTLSTSVETTLDKLPSPRFSFYGTVSAISIQPSSNSYYGHQDFRKLD